MSQGGWGGRNPGLLGGEKLRKKLQLKKTIVGCFLQVSIWGGVSKLWSTTFYRSC